MGDTYSFSEQQRNFIKLQFKYGVKLKRKLAAGEITQDYYDKNIWLASQSLENPYTGFWQEFKAAIESEDLQWLSRQVGESVGDLSEWIGTTAGNIAGEIIGGVSGGVARGLAGGLGVAGWVTVGLLGLGVWYAFKKGYAQKVIKYGFSTGIKMAV